VGLGSRDGGQEGWGAAVSVKDLAAVCGPRLRCGLRCETEEDEDASRSRQTHAKTTAQGLCRESS
jgi:hypothetical protein